MKILISIIIFIILLSCGNNKDQDFENLCPDFEIFQYEGSGWTGWRFEVTILYPDTLNIYERRYIPTFFERKAVYVISKNEIDSLFQDLKIIKNIKLRDYGFGPDKPKDLPTTFFKYKICNCTDSAGIYLPDENEVPDELNSIMGKVIRIVINYDTIMSKNVIE